MYTGRLKTFSFGIIVGMLILLSMAVITYFVVTYVTKVQMNTKESAPVSVAMKVKPEVQKEVKPVSSSLYVINGHGIDEKFVPRQRYQRDPNGKTYYDYVSDVETYAYTVDKNGNLKIAAVLYTVDSRVESVRDVVTRLQRKYELPYPGRYEDNGMYITDTGAGILVSSRDEGNGMFVVYVVVSAYPL